MPPIANQAARRNLMVSTPSNALSRYLRRHAPESGKGQAPGGARRAQTTADLGGAVSGARATGRANEEPRAPDDADATSSSRSFRSPVTAAMPGAGQIM